MFQHKCARCGGAWESVLVSPKKCGLCRNRYWDRLRVRRSGAGRPVGAADRGHDEGGSGVLAPAVEAKIGAKSAAGASERARRRGVPSLKVERQGADGEVLVTDLW